MTPPAGVVRAPSPEDVGAAVCHDVVGLLTPPLHVRELPGGHSWHTYEATDVTGVRVIVRVAPAGGTLDPYDPAAEATAMGAAAGAVPVPKVLACVDGPNDLGAPYAVHGWAGGQVLHLSDATDETERARYRWGLAGALGAIHRGGDPAALGPVPATVTEALATELQRTIEVFARSAACRHPGITVGLRWLQTRLPQCDEPPVLCHGDFRFHNLAWAGPGRLAAVLDWERAWVGDPMADVAFTRRFSGWCAVDGEAVAMYERASGRFVDEARVAYGDRFEQVRSYTSATRGLRALAEVHTDRLALFAIGEAGMAGAWGLVELLGDGPLARANEDGLDPAWVPAVSVDRQRELVEQAAQTGQDRLANHLADQGRHDVEARDRSLSALREAAGPRALQHALRATDPEVAWAGAYAVLAEAVVDGDASLLPALRALALRDTTRPTLRRTTTLLRGTA